MPVLEALYRAQWSNEDGLGALIISPTRELAMQIMDVLRTVGSKHYSLSAGLVVGGHDFATEAATIAQMNVLVATPGRLLQHLEQTVAFDPSNLQVLVLDEADRCLDMGFADTMRGILDTLPKHPQRQTLLFSATQTKSIKALAGLSLADPQYVAVHAASDTVTPKQLLQTYVVLPLEDKLNLLYSFLRTHTKNKSIVFLSSCKQTRFVFEVFRRMRPGVPLLHLHGKMKQARRMHIYYDFLKKPAAALFATDIAARGLDFPAVDWVVQADCPEDVQAYIHRVGRTARFKARGNALLALTPREAEGMLPALQEAKIPLKQITVNPDQALAATPKVAAEVAADPELKYVAQRAFVSYVRSVLLQGNKAVFDVNALDLPALAASLGLPQPPRVKGLKSAAASAAAKAAKNAPRALAKLRAKIAAAKAAGKGGGAGEDDSSDSESAEGGPRAPPRRRRVGSPTHPQREVPHKLAARMALAGGLAGDSDSEGGGGEEEEDDLLVPKASRGGGSRAGEGGSGHLREADLADPRALADLHPFEAARIRRITQATLGLAEELQHAASGSKAFQRLATERRGAVISDDTPVQADAEAIAAHHAAVRSRLQAADVKDKEYARERVREKHRKDKEEAKGGGYTLDGDEEEEEGGGGYTLGGQWADEEEEEEGESGWAHSSAPRGAKRGREAEDAAPAPAAAGSGTVQDAEAAALALLAKRRRTLL